MGTWLDYDDDGDQDLFLVNFAVNDNLNRLYRNMLVESGTPGFEEDPAVAMATDVDVQWSFGSSWADFDDDGDLDGYLSTLFTGSNNALYERTGPGTFVRHADSRNHASVSDASTAANCWADFDNDGDQDLFGVINESLPNPAAFGSASNLYFENDGTGNLVRTDAGIDDDGYYYSCAVADYDQDGDLDLYVATSGTESLSDGGNNLFYRNDEGNANNWLAVDLRGVQSNSFGIGARIHVTARIGGESRTQTRWISGSPSTVRGQNGYRAHFGIGGASAADEVVVEWPSGAVDTFTDVSGGRTIVITEGEGVSGVAVERRTIPTETVLEANYPDPFPESTSIAYRLERSSHVRLTLSDMLGRELRVLHDGYAESGRHVTRLDASDLPSGIYLARLRTERGVRSRLVHVVH
jgi:hypothetical protein